MEEDSLYKTIKKLISIINTLIDKVASIDKTIGNLSGEGTKKIPFSDIFNFKPKIDQSNFDKFPSSQQKPKSPQPKFFLPQQKKDAVFWLPRSADITSEGAMN